MLFNITTKPAPTNFVGVAKAKKIVFYWDESSDPLHARTIGYRYDTLLEAQAATPQDFGTGVKAFSSATEKDSDDADDLTIGNTYYYIIVFKDTNGNFSELSDILEIEYTGTNTTDLVGTIDTDQLGDGTVSITKFASSLTPVEIVSTNPTTGNYDGRVVYNTTDKKLYRYDSSVPGFVASVPATDVTGQLSDTQLAAISAAKITGQLVGSQIANGILTTAKFASGITPVEIVSTNPTTGNFDGRTVYNTTDKKMYRYNATTSSFVASVPAVDITGQLSDSQLAAISAAKLTGQIVAAQIADAALTTAKFASGITPVEIVSTNPTTGNFDGRIVYNTTDKKMYRYNSATSSFVASVPSTDITGQLSDSQLAAISAAKLTGQIVAAQIADAALTTAKFASGITPVEIVATNPTTGNFDGRIVYNSTDKKMYRYNGTSGQFEASVPAADITGTITGTQIANQAISIAKFASGLTPVEIVSTNPTTGNYDGRIVYNTTDKKMYRYNSTSGTFVASVPAADVTGQLSDSQLAAISAAKLTGQVVASQIADATLTTAKFAAGLTPVEIVSTNPTTGNFDGRIVYNTTDKKMYRYNGTSFVSTTAAGDVTGQLSDSQLAAISAAKLTGQVVASQIADATLTTAKFASGITPVEIVSTNPSTGNFDGRIVYNTTDKKMYRHNGTSFVATTAAADVTGQLADSQLAAVSAAKVTGTLSDSQIAALSAAKLTGTITTTQITDDAITTAKVAAGAITTAEIAANTIVAGDISAGTITATEIAAATITGAKIAAGTIAAGNIVANTITASQIAANTITASQIAADTITAGQIAAGAIASSELAAGAVIAGKITAGTIVAADIAASTITGAKIAAGTIAAGNIVAGTITTAEIAANTIVAADIAAGVITANEIAANTITAGQIAAAAITSSELASNSIIAGKIAAGTIVATDIAAATITGAKIAAGTITAGNILAGTVTANEIAANTITASQIAANTITASQIAANTITAGQIAAAAITASELAAGSIIASKLAIGDTSNMVRDPDCIDTSVWTGTTTVNSAGHSVTGVASKNFLYLAANTALTQIWNGADIPVEGGKQYFVSGYIGTNSGVSVTATLRVNWQSMDSNGNLTFISNVDVGTYTGTSFGKVSDIVTAPSNARRMQITAIKSASASAATNVFLEPIVRRAASGELIVDGAITAVKITAGTITATEIAATTITAAKIAANTITASQIAADTITAGQIAAGAISASELAANAVIAGKISAGTIVAADIAAATITGAKIAADTITAANVLAGTITTTEIAATTIVAGNIAAGTITASQIAADTITAGQIAAGAISSSEIAAGAIIAGKIAANAITTTEIAASTITGGDIAATTIAAGNIVAGTITSAQIAANTITAGQIAANTITATQIAANTITAGQIAAAAISTSELAANAITASKLAVGVISEDLILDPNFESGLTDMYSGSGGALNNIADTSAPGGGRVLQFDRGVTDSSVSMNRIYTNYIPVEAGDVYYSEFTIKGSGTSANGAYLRMLYYDANKAAYTDAGTGLSYVDFLTNTNITTSYVTKSNTKTIPSGVKYVRMQMYHHSTSTIQSLYVSNLTLRRLIPGSLVVSGTITATQIATDTITASNIAAGTITASEIASATITGTQIAATTITASNIAANTITASQIAADTITAGQISAGAISATEIASGAITTAKIAAGAVTANEIAANTITAAKIAANTITASQIAASTITATQLAAGAVTASKISVTDLAAINATLGSVDISSAVIGSLTVGTLNYAVGVPANPTLVQNNFDVNADGAADINLTMSWSSVTNAAGYDVEVYQSDTSGGSFTLTGKGGFTTGNSFTFPANTSKFYRTRVRARNGWTQAGSFTTTLIVGVTTYTFSTYAGFQPSKNAASGTTPTCVATVVTDRMWTIKASCNPASESDWAFTRFYWASTNNFTTAQSNYFIDSKSGEAEFVGLKGATTYYFFAQHFNSHGQSSPASSGSGVSVAASLPNASDVIANSSILATKMATDSIDTVNIIANAVTYAKLATNVFNNGISAMAVGDVGTYAFLKKTSVNTASPGDTVAGSNLVYTDTALGSGANPSGTWMCMGRCPQNQGSLWLRVS